MYLLQMGMFLHAYDRAAFVVARVTGYRIRRVHRSWGDLLMLGFAAPQLDSVRERMVAAGIELRCDDEQRRLWSFVGGDDTFDEALVDEPRVMVVQDRMNNLVSQTHKPQEPKIFSDGDKLLDLVMTLVPKIQKLYRYNLGSEMLTLSIRMNLEMRQANSARGKEKLPHINMVLDCQGTLELMLRKLHDHRVISSEQHAQFIVTLTSIGKQANGWKNYYSE